MGIFETYLQKAWGDSLEDVKMSDIHQAISETIEMDNEHGAFWVGICDLEEIVLEANKDLTVIAAFPNTGEITAKFSNWDEIEQLYKLFLQRDFNSVKEILQANPNQNQ